MKKICVMGLGYIGLPTSCMFANNGFEVLGVDIDEEIIGKLNSGKVHIDEPDLEEAFNKAIDNNKLKVSLEAKPSDVYIITVPTPLNGNKAELKYVMDASREIARHIVRDNIIILENIL